MNWLHHPACVSSSLNISLECWDINWKKAGLAWHFTCYADYSKKKTFLSVIGPTQFYFLSVHSIIYLSHIVKVNNRPKYSAGPRTINQGFVPVLREICLSGPVRPTISEKSVIVVYFTVRTAWWSGCVCCWELLHWWSTITSPGVMSSKLVSFSLLLNEDSL